MIGARVWATARAGGRPSETKVEPTDDVGLHLPRMLGTVSHHHADLRRGQARELIFDRANVAAMPGQPNTLGEGSEAVLDLDLRRAGA